MKRILLGFVRVYRGLISPLLPSSCRFYPTCSAYSEEAIARYGTMAGLKLSIRRVSRCHPWCEGGYDPVP
jgi:putative membrane protein insertion efficiency factor